MKLQETESSTIAKKLCWIFFVLICLWVLMWICIDCFVPVDDRGAFGDKFGSINSFFSALAFGGIIIAIYLQTKELGLQREELKSTREELEGQKQEMQQANELMKQFQFENTFFNLLSDTRKNANSLDFNSHRGRNAITEICQSFNNTLNARKRFDRQDMILGDPDLGKDFDDWYKEIEIFIGDHIRSLVSVVKFVDLNCEKRLDKNLYIDFLRTRLSSKEVELLFYYSFSEKNSEIRMLIAKYSLLKNLPLRLENKFNKNYQDIC